jgi:hypothetical protein
VIFTIASTIFTVFFNIFSTVFRFKAAMKLSDVTRDQVDLDINSSSHLSDLQIVVGSATPEIPIDLTTRSHLPLGIGGIRNHVKIITQRPEVVLEIEGPPFIEVSEGFFYWNRYCGYF